MPRSPCRPSQGLQQSLPRVADGVEQEALLAACSYPTICRDDRAIQAAAHRRSGFTVTLYLRFGYDEGGRPSLRGGLDGRAF